MAHEMSEYEFQKQAMSVAIDLLRDDVDEKTYLGDLYLKHDSGGLWQVYKEENAERDRIDVIRPNEFGAAQLLASYLIILSNRDAATPDLPRTPTHSSNLVK